MTIKSCTYFLVIISFLFISCDQSTIKPSSSGKAGELLVVSDSLIWKSDTGRKLHDSLSVSFPGIPQHEPFYRVVHIHPSGFRNILQHHRNVLFLEKGPLPDEKKFSLTFKNDLYAKNQLVMHLRAVDDNWLDSAVAVMSASVVEKFSKEELIRSVSAYTGMREMKVTRDVREHMGITIPLTDDYFVARKETNFTWVRRETVHMSQGFQIYLFPYVSDTAFNPNALIGLRDSLSRIYIPGPSENSFMTTDSVYPVSYTGISVNGQYAVELRGLWRTEGDFMGGPFVTYLIHDKSKEQLIFIDAYIYAPRFKKREYVKQMEAMVHALTF